MRYVIIATLILSLVATSSTLAAPPSTCGMPGEYERALCAYQQRSFDAAEAGFRSLLERDEADAVTIRSMYFLARTMMKSGRFTEASALFIRIYDLDRGFYSSWNCDFLLGECRRAVGK
ncbi:MAG TPA: hypothetical protein VF701_20055 [Thermoanaerobaculia bacterium]